ncbi:MAG: phosphatase PAP2 family protein, partial [Planctomycetota bacterium]
CHRLASLHADVPSFYHPLEEKIPFLPWMIFPYLALHPFFVSAFFLVKTRDELDLLTRRIAVLYVVSAIVFVAIPLQVAFTRPTVDGVTGWHLSKLDIDPPFNQFPSLHVSLLFPIWSVLRARLRGIAVIALGLALALVAVSTVFVYQHHSIDVIGGAILGALVLRGTRPNPSERAQ